MKPIQKEVTVEASQETAFNVFTRKMTIWWPADYHVGTAPMTEMVLEPVENGRWYTKHQDGSEVNVGHILKWNPFEQLLLAWQIDGDFKYDSKLITEVEVNFIPEGAKTTRVTFEHRNLDLLTGGGKAVESMDGGWEFIMNSYKEVASNEA